MKILMVLMSLEIGGAETHVVELSKELARRGHEIVVASNGGVFTAELNEAGIRHIKLPLHSRRVNNMLKSYLGLKRVLQNESFDLIHAHARIPGFICGLLHKKLKFRFITTTHWVFKTGPILNIMTNWGERTIAVSDDIKNYLINNYNLPENHITVTINGIDTSKFSPSVNPSDVISEFKMSASEHRAVYVSRMDADRSAAALNLIDITPELCRRYPDFEAVIVGGGNDFERVKNAAQECNKKLGRNAVIITGSRTDINKFVAASDVFIGVSRAVLEAMAGSKPVIIAGNEGYIGLFDETKLEVGIETNFCCRGCELTTSKALLRDMIAVLDKTKQQRNEMGEYNRKVILDLYAEKRMADDCEKAYADLLSIDRKRPNDIIISGYYGYKNTGDDSLLYAMIKNIREIKPNADITVLSFKPHETRRIYGVKSINRFNLFRILAAMKHAKLLISGGGSLMQDVTSTKSLLYYLFIIKAAKKYGMKVMIYASGIGPIKNRNNRRLAGTTLNAVDLITLREPASEDELKLLGVDKPPVYVTADPVFTLEKANDKIVDGIFKKENISLGKKYFVVNVRPWRKAEAGFAEKISQLCDYISERYDMTAIFLPAQPSLDISANKQITDKMKSEFKVIKGTYSAQELIGVMERTQLVIGMRLHVLIYAATAGVPVFGLSYDPKIDALLSYLCQHYKEDVENASLERMKKGIDEIMSENQHLKENLLRQKDAMKVKASNDARLAVDLLQKQ